MGEVWKLLMVVFALTVIASVTIRLRRLGIPLNFQSMNASGDP